MTNITLTVTADEANVIALGLGKLPMEVAFPVWTKIKQQADEQHGVPEKPAGEGTD